MFMAVIPGGSGGVNCLDQEQGSCPNRERDGGVQRGDAGGVVQSCCSSGVRLGGPGWGVSTPGAALCDS